MKAKSETKKTEPVRDTKREAERRKRLEPAKHLEGNVAKLVERGRLMGF
jgi:hypothetical protein